MPGFIGLSGSALNGWILQWQEESFLTFLLFLILWEIRSSGLSARRGEWETESVFDGTGKFVIPGLVDIHMHVESSMTYPEEFSRAVVPFGVTTVVADPHEIANVFGVEGILRFYGRGDGAG